MIRLLLQHFFSRRFPAFAAAAVLAGTAQPVRKPAQSVSAAEVSRPLPVITMQTGQGDVQEEYSEAVISVQDEDGSADLTDTACKVRLRGNSSRRTPKKSYKLHFPGKANPLGTGDGAAKTWALISNGFDASLLRNWTAMQIGAQLDALPFTPNCRSVQLYLNGKYLGVYLLIETVSVNSHRINLTEAPEEVSGNGYLLEMTRYAQEPDFYAGSFHFEVKSRLSDDAEKAAEQVGYISGYTDAALRALRGGSQDEAAQYLDIASLADNCLANEIFKNIDVGWDSYYFTKDAGGKLKFGPVWDFDLAFGNGALPYGYQPAEGESAFALSDATEDCNPWICYAMRCGWFRSLLKARFEEMLPELRKIPAAVLAEQAAHAEAYQENYDNTNYSFTPFLPFPDSSEPYYTQAAQAEILADWVEKRLDWLDTYYHSPEFADGIFPDDQGNAMTLDNLLSVSLLSQLNEYRECSDLCYTAPAGDGRQITSFRPFMLEAGERYCLTFDYSCTGSAEIVCQFQNQTVREPLTVTAGSETQHAELYFVPERTDTQTGLSFVGNGSGTVRLDHIVLRRAAAEAVSGDLNGDGACSIADAVLLMKWLCCEPETVLPDWRAGDLNADGRLDARDLALLKALLLSQTA